jgi:hypothetical protein
MNFFDYYEERDRIGANVILKDICFASASFTPQNGRNLNNFKYQ